jgi:hypothetical protein
MKSLSGLRLLAALLRCARFPRSVIVVKRHPHQPVPYPDDRSDTDQDNSKCGRDTPGGAEDQHQDAGDDGRNDQEPSCGANKHLC